MGHCESTGGGREHALKLVGASPLLLHGGNDDRVRLVCADSLYVVYGGRDVRYRRILAPSVLYTEGATVDTPRDKVENID